MTTETPSAAEIAAIRNALARHDDYLKQPWGPQLPGPRADYERLRDMMPDFVRKLLAAVEAQAAHIGALESANRWLKSRLSPHDGKEYDIVFNRPPEGE